LLDGILHQSVDNVEIIIVDSGSTDATLAVASRFPVKIVNIKPANFSFGRALNVGCAHATGDYIIIASAHVYPVYDSWIKHLTAPLANSKVALVYGRQQGNERTRFSEHQLFAQWYPEESISRQDHPFCNNANAAIRRESWVRFPYNEELTGLEDLDWAKRVMAAGYQICYSSEAKVVHVHSETFGGILNRYRREAIALKQIMPHQHFSLWDFARLLTFNTASDYYQAFRERVLIRNLIDIPMFRLMQFLGTYLGFSQHGPVTKQLRERFYYPRISRQSSVNSGTPIGREISYGSGKKKSKEQLK
jgi:glycosyltransferase involved in cell wall biosynthesis